ncbi:hypothetical protein [Salinimicrobium sediminilitoris]|uniref:hypothetical protein n=1 Tax=Salinimicrobium sediminilitoris TaxID=2876715 RepID=UPI001E338E24|nr:hypothetical protein [Salinimicrobium sediminilitoris]MCC8360612.1 hypothetical protein [Salinimicrobium sediminilitoris]
MEFSQLDFIEIRNWILLVVGLIGIVITLRTFRNSTKRRKIDNTYKTLEFLRDHIGIGEINKFIELFQANNEISGVKYNEFRFEDGQTDTIENMFSEGGCGNGEIHNMIELFNLISPTLQKLETKIIWYEYGQIMIKIHSWTKYLQGLEPKDKRKSFYSDFNSYMDKNWKKMLNEPTKTYIYAE